MSPERLHTPPRPHLQTKHGHMCVSVLCLLLTARNVRAGQVFCGELHPRGGEGGWEAKEQARSSAQQLQGRLVQGTPCESGASDATEGWPDFTLCAFVRHGRRAFARPSGWTECMRAAGVPRGHGAL